MSGYKSEAGSYITGTIIITIPMVETCRRILVLNSTVCNEKRVLLKKVRWCETRDEKH